MAKYTIEQTETNIDNNVTMKMLDVFKDYMTKMFNMNMTQLVGNINSLKTALEGTSAIVGHFGKALPPADSDPASPNQGDWYFNNTSKEFKMFNNNAWVVMAHLSAVVDAYTKAETDAKLGDKQDELTPEQSTVVDANAFTDDYKTKVDNSITKAAADASYEPLSKKYKPTVAHQSGFIIFDEAQFTALPVGSVIWLDMININHLLSDASSLPAAGDQTFIGTGGAIRIPNSVGTAALKWETKTNPTDVNVKDNYKTKYFVLEKKTDTEYDFIRLEDRPSVDLGSVKISAEHTVVGEEAGGATPGTYITAIGAYAGFENQGDNATAVGSGAGGASQSDHATAVGSNSGANHQGQFATAVGAEAGSNKQGAFSVAMGPYAGQFNQPAKSMVFNASPASHSPSAENEILMVAGTTVVKADNNGIYLNGANLMNGTGINVGTANAGKFLKVKTDGHLEYVDAPKTIKQWTLSNSTGVVNLGGGGWEVVVPHEITNAHIISANFTVRAGKNEVNFEYSSNKDTVPLAWNHNRWEGEITGMVVKSVNDPTKIRWVTLLVYFDENTHKIKLIGGSYASSEKGILSGVITYQV